MRIRDELGDDVIRTIAERYGIGVELKDYRKDKIWYLSHPLTTCGDMKDNYEDERVVAAFLYGERFEHLVRPLDLLPEDREKRECARTWHLLLQACDGIILSGEWENSEGCLAEYRMAKAFGMDIIYVYHNDGLITYTYSHNMEDAL